MHAERGDGNPLGAKGVAEVGTGENSWCLRWVRVLDF
jgi:hypothetical protein